jgi:nucleoid-associated protein YgaU
MPVSIISRYYGAAIYSADDPEGNPHPTVAIRPPAPPGPNVTIYNHLVTGIETIEYLAWRYYGDSTLWWRIAEANGLQYPMDLQPGSLVGIPGANDIGTVVRNRSFG